MRVLVSICRDGTGRDCGQATRSGPPKYVCDSCKRKRDYAEKHKHPHSNRDRPRLLIQEQIKDALVRIKNNYGYVAK